MSFTMFSSRWARAALLTATCIAPMGCGATPPDSPEPTSTEESAIINGSSVASGTATTQGVVIVGHLGYNCTGTVMRNDFVLTARHCITTDHTVTGPADLNAINYGIFMDSTVAPVSEVIDITGNRYDLAIIVATPWLKPGSSGHAYGWSRATLPGPDTAIYGTTLTCYGYGDNTYTGGGGTLRSESIFYPVGEGVNSPWVEFWPNGYGQIQWKGDSGSTCFTSSGQATVVTSNCTTDGSTVQNCEAVGSSEVTTAVSVFLVNFNPSGYTYTASSSNSVFDSMLISNSIWGSDSAAGVAVTQNWNPPNTSAAYNNHNVGVWWTGSGWAVFNEDVAAMNPTSYNVGFFNSHTIIGSGCNECLAGVASGDSMTTNIKNPNAILLVTPLWNPPGVTGGSATYNNHPPGVWWNGSQWMVYNDDLAAMSSSMFFDVIQGDPNDGAFLQETTSSNTGGDFTVIDNPNLNGQPGATVFVTHNFNPQDGSGLVGYNNHPIGVFYTGSNWAIFNEDEAPMQTGLAFNVVVMPAAPGH
jgi:hypothetical protein